MTTHSACRPWFAHTTPWLYKAFHFALIVSSFRDQALLISASQALQHAVPVIVMISVLPSVVHPVRSRSHTTALVVQILMMLSLLNAATAVATRRGHADASTLLLQLVGGHLFYSLCVACLSDRALLLCRPFAVIVFGVSAVILPVLASMLGPRPAFAEGAGLIGCFCVGEVLGFAAYVLALFLRAVGWLYEELVRITVG
jgi:hypothetical protein